jgi:hypothetical protein
MEGTMACGHAQYSYDLFAKSFYDHVENKGIINSSSDLKHFYWHVATYESWGEPQKIYRQSMIEHRLRSQHLMIADLMPKKMGQFRITTDTKTADIEWSMALGAGYDAGIDFYVSPKIIKKNPEGEQILAAIKKWEAARLSGAFTEEEKGVMRNPKSECHLTQEDGKWKMTYRKWK